MYQKAGSELRDVAPSWPGTLPKAVEICCLNQEKLCARARLPKLPYKLGGVLRSRLHYALVLIGRPLTSCSDGTLDLCRAADVGAGTRPGFGTQPMTGMRSSPAGGKRAGFPSLCYPADTDTLVPTFLDLTCVTDRLRPLLPWSPRRDPCNW